MEEIINNLEKQLKDAMDGADWYQTHWKRYEEKIISLKVAIENLKGLKNDNSKTR